MRTGDDDFGCGCPSCVAKGVKIEMLRGKQELYFTTTSGQEVAAFVEAFGDLDAIAQLGKMEPKLLKGVFVAAVKVPPQHLPAPELVGRLLTPAEMKTWLEEFNRKTQGDRT